jgi:hypothetical protein
MLDEKSSSKQMIIDIESMARFSKTLLGQGKSYFDFHLGGCRGS